MPLHIHCNNRVVLSPTSETYCRQETGHTGECDKAPKHLVTLPAIQPIPCECIDCKASRRKKCGAIQPSGN